jgi:Flp pilus assembly protein TadD
LSTDRTYLRAVAAFAPIALITLSLRAGPDLSQQHASEGIRLRKTGRYCEAESLLRQALAETDRDEDQAIILDNLGSLLCLEGSARKRNTCYSTP